MICAALAASASASSCCTKKEFTQPAQPSNSFNLRIPSSAGLLTAFQFPKKNTFYEQITPGMEGWPVHVHQSDRIGRARVGIQQGHKHISPHQNYPAARTKRRRPEDSRP